MNRILVQRRPILMPLLLILTLLLAACGGTAAPAANGGAAATTAPAPVADNAATAAPADSVATSAPADNAATAPADGPTITPTVLNIVSGGEGCAPNAAKITWYVGLGAGTDADVLPKQTNWVNAYNKSQTEACLVLQVVHNPESYDTLKAQIAAGTAPDIVGPVGKSGRASFQGAWADITPLAQKVGYDLTQYDQTLLDFVKDDNVQVGLPFALYPGAIWYNKTLFDEAKLPYPPHKVGEMYQGKPWDLDAFTALAKELTVDSNGNTPDDATFDNKSITQFGLWMGFTDARRFLAMFGGGVPFEDAAPTTAKIPENWRAAWKWYYDGIWTTPFMPNSDYASSDQFAKGNAFSSGNVAMTWSMSWYTCCFDLAKMNWDVAVVPMVNGKTTAGMDGDTFAIMKQSKNPEIAFKVLSKMVQDEELAQIYGGLPGKAAARPDFYKQLDARTGSNKIDWQVLEEMIKYPDIPNHEAWLPNLIKANDAFNKFKGLMDGTPGLNIDQEIDKLQTEVDTLFKEPGAMPTSR